MQRFSVVLRFGGVRGYFILGWILKGEKVELVSFIFGIIWMIGS